MEQNKNIDDLNQISEEDLEEAMSETDYSNTESTYFSEPIILDEKLYAKSPDFEKGVNLAMEYAGMYSTFVGNGISAEDSIVLILNLINSQMNINSAEINTKATIESVKIKNDLEV